jgi:hypothetical protein
MTDRKLPTPCLLGAESWFLASLFTSYDARSHPSWPPEPNRVRVWSVVDAI